jgi:hypothetical protein
MNNLIEMLDALDTALSTEEELEIQKPLFSLFPADRTDLDWISLVQKCDEILAILEASILIEDVPLL